MSLEFIPEVRRWSNFYFFVQNLSGWHPSTRPKHNKEWREEVVFSQEAETAISRFKTIHERYSFGDMYLGRPFFLHDNPWDSVEKIVTKDELVDLKNIFDTIEPCFDIIYKKDEQWLHEWEDLISKPEFTESAVHINETLARFYGCNLYSEQCTVYLLLSTKDKNGGGANIKNNAVILEVSRTPVALESEIRGVLWHELIHLYFNKCILMRLLQQYTKCNWPIIGRVDELVASALLPNGLLTLKTNDVVLNKKFNSRIPNEEILQTQELIYPYLNGGKQIDEPLAHSLLALAMQTK